MLLTAPPRTVPEYIIIIIIINNMIAKSFRNVSLETGHPLS